MLRLMLTSPRVVPIKITWTRARFHSPSLLASVSRKKARSIKARLILADVYGERVKVGACTRLFHGRSNEPPINRSLNAQRETVATKATTCRSSGSPVDITSPETVLLSLASSFLLFFEFSSSQRWIAAAAATSVE